MSRRVVVSTVTAVLVVFLAVMAIELATSAPVQVAADDIAAAGSADTGVPADPAAASPASAAATDTTMVPTTSSPVATAPPTTAPPTTTTVPGLPAGSGSGHRVVFSVEQQRMWWVDGAEQVVRTALVSGRERTPQTGTFQVYSKTEHATGLDGSRMEHFVRFTKGPNGWAIGFHAIPEMNGQPVQTQEQLGTPLSHGCIRQAADDAQFTWDWLDVGSTVVVVA